MGAAVRFASLLVAALGVTTAAAQDLDQGKTPVPNLRRKLLGLPQQPAGPRQARRHRMVAAKLPAPALHIEFRDGDRARWRTSRAPAAPANRPKGKEKAAKQPAPPDGARRTAARPAAPNTQGRRTRGAPAVADAPATPAPSSEAAPAAFASEPPSQASVPASAPAAAPAAAPAPTPAPSAAATPPAAPAPAAAVPAAAAAPAAPAPQQARQPARHPVGPGLSRRADGARVRAARCCTGRSRAAGGLHRSRPAGLAEFSGKERRRRSGGVF